MKRLLLAAVAVCVHVALGETYVWQGTDGDWNKAANWSPNGTPGAGDLAVFESGAEITSEIVIGEGVLTISNAVGTALHLKGVVSGAGGIDKGGEGSLHLHAANTFAGKLVSTGTGDAKWGGGDTSHSSDVYLYQGAAAGLGGIEMDQDYASGHGARLFFDGSDGVTDFVISVPVAVSGDGIQAGQVLSQNGVKTIDFQEDFTSLSRFNFGFAAGSTVIFRKRCACGSGSYFVLSWQVDYHFHGPIVSGTWSPSWGSRYHFYSPGSTITGSFSVNDPYYCHGENVLPVCATANVFSRSDNKEDFRPYVDFCGYDQTYSANVAIGFHQNLNGNADFGFTSPADAPARLIMNGAVAAQPGFWGNFKGSAGLEWNPDDGSREFCFVSNQVQTTVGEFAAKSGTIRFRDGCGFSQLGKLSVASGAAVVLDDDAARNNFVTAIELENGVKLGVGANVRILCKGLKVGERDLDEGVYTADEGGADFIDGAGTIEVWKGDENTWTGEVSGDWNEPGNWSCKRVPGRSDQVVLSGSSAIVTSSAASARLRQLSVSDGAKLVFSTWDGAISADRVVISGGSTVTCAGPFTNDLQKCRVYFKCRDFELDATSTIDVNDKGWKGGFYTKLPGDESNWNGNVPNPDGNATGGWGPGRNRGISDYATAASHLGQGGNPSVISAARSLTYDDPYAPVEPGSGGRRLTGTAYSECRTAIGSGGGAVLIEATGDVTVNGRILACGHGSSTHWHFIDNIPECSNTAGSGGAVRILCSTIAGSGVIRADGGNGNDGSHCPPAGGGGVAIACDDAKQVAGACAGLTISASEGLDDRGDYTTYGAGDHDCWTAEPGTVYLTSKKIVDDTIGRTLCGRLVGFTEYIYDGDLDWTWGHVRFAETGVTVTVTGNLALNGENVRVDLGGNHSVTNWGRRIWVDAGDVPVSLAVGGDLTVADGATFVVYAAKNEMEDAWGASVAVAGAFTVGAGGTVCPMSNHGYGGAPHFTAGSFMLDAQGLVNGAKCGGAGAWNSSTYSSTYGSRTLGVGLGAGREAGAGAGHADVGGCSFLSGAKKAGSGGKAYDDPYRPTQSGSGGGSGGYSAATDGGGVFHLACTGPVTVDGTIDVSAGLQTGSGSTSWYYSAGSGGTIFLSGTTLAGAATAKLLARGGDTTLKGDPTTVAGAGAGGRISLWFGAQHEGKRSARTHHATDRDASVFKGGFANWKGTADAGGGTNVIGTAGYTPIEGSFGKPGTVWYNAIFVPGIMMQVW